MKRYGVMGGTFDPIHIGHLMVAEQAKSAMNLDEVIFIPTGNPPHKNNVTDAIHRLNMTELAIKENKYFSISNMESISKEYSFTIKTINKLKERIEGEIYFIIGSDSLFELNKWKNIEELSKLIEFVCILRPKFELKVEVEYQLNFLKENYNTKVNLINTPLFEVSSTEIRKYIKDNRSLKYIVPDAVLEYIKDNDLYVK